MAINKTLTKADVSEAGVKPHAIVVRGPDGVEAKTDFIAQEKAIAMVYNGISHAVMMATPADLVDFAVGFSLSEGIVDTVQQLRSIEVMSGELGYEVHIDIASSSFMHLKQRRRQLNGRSGCGICGIESLEAVQPQVPRLSGAQLPAYAVVAKAMAQMHMQQPLQARCGAVHAAAFADINGDTIALREDVGRHNALDKLLGVMASQNSPFDHTQENAHNRAQGFVVISSRASYEMVAKAAGQAIATLVSASAPTGMAIDLARRANMNLIGFVREARQVIYHQADFTDSCTDMSTDTNAPHTNNE